MADINAIAEQIQGLTLLGDGNQCRRPQLGGGSRSGREEKQVLGVIWRRGAEFSGVQ